MDSFIDWPRIMFSLSNARSSSGNGEPTGDNGQDVSHANLWHEPWDGPSWSAGPPTTSGFELASFQSAYEHIPNLSQNADDEVRASDAWHRVRSQATSFTPAAYPYTRRLFRNTSTTAAESSPSRELSPQAFHRRFGITTLANSTSVGNISPKEPSATKGSSEETETPSVSPTLPQTNKENADVAHRSKPSTSIPLEDKSEKQPLAGPSKPDIPRKVTRSQQPRPSKRRRKEDDKAPASIGGSSRLRGVSPVQRTTRIRVPGGRRLTALATAGQIDLSGAPPLFPPPSSSSTPTPVAGPSSAPTLSAGKIHGQSVRVRRTKAELEQRAAPKVKRCGILNCSEDIGATPADANKHIKAHYERAAALLAAGVTMAGVAEDVARSSTSSGHNQRRAPTLSQRRRSRDRTKRPMNSLLQLASLVGRVGTPAGTRRRRRL
ncbi:hypothetical protein BD413DRAFT_673636 [Trametes elegans]|nr:hypothetical protein BD413DRAFT_673636 [Trametes elegans]